jgi:glycosyltransferase involved in cell wall biosynthesis
MHVLKRMKDYPLVSVVIPTFNRPDMVLRAVESVLNQSFSDTEILTVIDGDDEHTSSSLKSRCYPKLRIIQLTAQCGGSHARNEGVREARGEWIALLDDDDIWFPRKLEKQLAIARASKAAEPIVACKVLARTASGDFQWPRKLPSEPLSEYLLARNSWSQGENLLQTSTLFARRRLLLEVGFAEGLQKHQDWDWLLRVTQMPGVKIEFIDEPLSIWSLEPSRNSVSRRQDWQGSLAWIRNRRELVTRRAYAGFIATQTASQAARQKDWKAFKPLLTEMFQVGRPKAIDIFLLFGMWFVPVSWRDWLRSS